MEGYIGEVRLFAGNFAPNSWEFCDGQLLPVGGNEELFSIIGNQFGGDGSSNFALPDLRGRLPVNPGGSAQGLDEIYWAERGGLQTVTLNEHQLPSHTHASTGTPNMRVHIMANSENGSSPSPNGKYLAKSVKPAGHADGEPVNTYSVSQDGASVKGGGVSGSVHIQVNQTGGSQPHENRMPYIGINFIICINGHYPQRN